MRQNIGHYLTKANYSLLLVALLAAIPTTLHAWGSMGHRIVAEVAQRHLDPKVASRVDDILDGRKLAEVATWPDDIRSDVNWSCAAPFHYVTVPPEQTYFGYNATLPEDKRPEGDALRAIAYFESVLSDRMATHDEKKKALSFLVHLVGDLHEPLHNGRGCDRGGNMVSVNFFGEDTNLHVVWDEGLIERERLSYTEFAEFVDHLSKPAIVKLVAASPLDWVNESQQLLDGIYTCDATARGDRCTCFCGDCADGKSVFGGCQSNMCSPMQAGPINLKYGYKAQHIGTLHTQLAHGGVRLAGMLNRSLARSPQKHPGYRAYQDFKAQIDQMDGWDAAVIDCVRKNAAK